MHMYIEFSYTCSGTLAVRLARETFSLARCTQAALASLHDDVDDHEIRATEPDIDMALGLKLVQKVSHRNHA